MILGPGLHTCIYIGIHMYMCTFVYVYIYAYVFFVYIFEFHEPNILQIFATILCELFSLRASV